MTILRGGGGSTNIMYVAISAARQKPRIQTQTSSAFLRRLCATPFLTGMWRARDDLLGVETFKAGSGGRSRRRALPGRRKVCSDARGPRLSK